MVNQVTRFVHINCHPMIQDPTTANKNIARALEKHTRYSALSLMTARRNYISVNYKTIDNLYTCFIIKVYRPELKNIARYLFTSWYISGAVLHRRSISINIYTVKDFLPDGTKRSPEPISIFVIGAHNKIYPCSTVQMILAIVTRSN